MQCQFAGKALMKILAICRTEIKTKAGKNLVRLSSYSAQLRQALIGADQEVSGSILGLTNWTQ